MKKQVQNILINDKVKNIAVYVRVSTFEQAKEGYGIDSQIRICKAQIKANEDKGWKYNEKFLYIDDGISGATYVDERKALSRLKKDIIEGNIDTILVFKIDRLFRKASLLLEFIEFLEMYGVNFVSKSESIDLSSATGKLILTLLGAIAEMERQTIAERTTEGRISKAISGYFVYGNNVAYGYKKVFDGKGNKLEINKKEAKIVKKIFDMYLSEGRGTGEIARYLTGLGIGTNIDNRDNPSKTKTHKNLFRQTWVAKVLRNEIYIGNCYVNKTETKKGIDGKEYKQEKDKSEWILIKCPAILDEHTFNKTQEKLDKSFIYSGRGEKHVFTGKIKCFCCNHTYNFYKSHKGTGNYRCGGKKKDKVSKNNLCTNPDISEEKLLNIVWPKIHEFINKPDKLIKEYIETHFIFKRLDKKGEYVKEMINIEKIIENKNILIKNALKEKLENHLLKNHYDKIINDYLLDLQALEKRIAEIKVQERSLDDLLRSGETLVKLSAKYKKDLGNQDIINKEALIDIFVDYITIKKDSIVVRYRFEKD